MTVEVVKTDDIWTIIHNRPESRNAMDPESAGAARFSAGAGRHGDFENIE